MNLILLLTLATLVLIAVGVLAAFVVLIIWLVRKSSTGPTASDN